MAASLVRHITAGTSAALPDIPCRLVSILNTSGAVLEIGVNEETINLPDGKPVQLQVNNNAKEITVSGSGEIQCVFDS